MIDKSFIEKVWDDIRFGFFNNVDGDILCQSECEYKLEGEIYEGSVLKERFHSALPPRVVISKEQVYMEGPQRSTNDWNDEWFRGMEVRIPEEEETEDLIGKRIPMAGCYLPKTHTVVLFPVCLKDQNEETVVHELFHAFHHSVMYDSPTWLSRNSKRVKIVKESLADYYAYLWCKRHGNYAGADRLFNKWYRYRKTDWPYRYALYFLNNGNDEKFWNTLLNSAQSSPAELVKQIKKV